MTQLLRQPTNLKSFDYYTEIRFTAAEMSDTSLCNMESDNSPTHIL